VFSVIVALSITDGGMDFLDLFFESVSAFGTVGLSTGITPMVSQLGQLILVLAMFVGRLGPFTIGIAMAQSSTTDRYRFVQERVTIG
jgi:trk system potassium uptake protein TrkH